MGRAPARVRAYGHSAQSLKGAPGQNHLRNAHLMGLHVATDPVGIAKEMSAVRLPEL
jgi:hypothetical protein